MSAAPFVSRMPAQMAGTKGVYRDAMSAILPGEIRQNGYVVRDLDAAMEAWIAVGIGPWFTIRELQQPLRCRGVASDPVISIAFANSGPLQIELIQQHNNEPSAYREFLDAGREGFHHLAWWAEDFSSTMARAHAAGWPILHDGDGGGTQFAYFELGGVTSTAIEVSELSDATYGMNKMVEDAAASWDGVTDPVRRLM
jgi:hypothetical protein